MSDMERRIELRIRAATLYMQGTALLVGSSILSVCGTGPAASFTAFAFCLLAIGALWMARSARHDLDREKATTDA